MEAFADPVALGTHFNVRVFVEGLHVRKPTCLGVVKDFAKRGPLIIADRPQVCKPSFPGTLSSSSCWCRQRINNQSGQHNKVQITLGKMEATIIIIIIIIVMDVPLHKLQLTRGVDAL